jgi:hypothetical protein
MTFTQAGVPVRIVPRAKQQAFYVLAPQTDTAQGETPGFFHDHVIETSPSEGGFTPFMRGYLVICSPEGISAGDWTFNTETPPGGAPIPLTESVTGYDLMTAEGIQAAADAGLVLLLDTGRCSSARLTRARRRANVYRSTDRAGEEIGNGCSHRWTP